MEAPASRTIEVAFSRGACEVFPSSSLNATKPAREQLLLGHLCQVWLKTDSQFLSSWVQGAERKVTVILETSMDRDEPLAPVSSRDHKPSFSYSKSMAGDLSHSFS